MVRSLFTHALSRFALCAGLLLAAAPAARAGFLGSTVTAENLVPDVNSVANTQTATVTGGLTFADIPNIDLSVGFTDTTITITNLLAGSFFSDPFNGLGFSFTGASGPITGVTVDGSSTMLPSSMVTYDADDIFVNYEGVGFTPVGAFTQLDVTFGPSAGGTGNSGAVVPLPPAIWPGLVTAAGLACYALRRRLA